MRRLAVVAAALLLAGCAGLGEPEPVKIPDSVPVPIAVPCVAPADVPARPATLADDQIKAMPDGQATLQTWVERAELVRYADKAAAVLAGCTGTVPASPAKPATSPP